MSTEQYQLPHAIQEKCHLLRAQCVPLFVISRWVWARCIIIYELVQLKANVLERTFFQPEKKVTLYRHG